MARTLLLIDDDELTREMLALLLAEDGWQVLQAESGEAALQSIAKTGPPTVIVSDLQMPGVAGEALAAALRAACGEGAFLLAMSATLPQKTPAGFDGALQKPLDAAMVRSAWEGLLEPRLRNGVDGSGGEEDLSEEIYAQLAAKLSSTQIADFYRFALQDAKKRSGTLKDFFERGDDAAFRAEAHALKGGCGMVGASGVVRLAAEMERTGITQDTASHLKELVQSVERLHSILAVRRVT